MKNSIYILVLLIGTSSCNQKTQSSALSTENISQSEKQIAYYESYTIGNENISATILTKGAELASFKSDGKEYIWQADAEHWNRHAPILFPIVGKLKDNEYSYKGKTYKMKQHGFARDYDFKVIAQDKNSITFQQTASPETKKQFPFDYILNITYTLKNKELTTDYKVENPMENNLYFSIGAHPAFNCPMEEGHQRNEYKLVFDKKESPNTKDKNGAYYIEEYTKVFEEAGTLKLPDTIFEEGSLTFNPNPFEKVTFVHGPTQNEYLSVTFKRFPYLGIWSPDAESPFVCIEPWHGISDNLDHDKDFTKKEGVIKLEAGQRFRCEFTIEIIN